MPVPGSPVPALSFPCTVDDVQVPAFPVVVSVKVITADFATARPPGVTVHVLAVLADDGIMPELIANSAATEASSAAAVRLRI